MYKQKTLRLKKIPKQTNMRHKVYKNIIEFILLGRLAGPAFKCNLYTQGDFTGES